MFGFTRSALASLAVANILALVGVIAVQRSGNSLVDFLGLLCVVAGVNIAALTNTETRSH
jgi:hypothetical protein